MTAQEREYVAYMLNEAKELAASYNEQLSNAQDFVRWNLPDEFGADWIAARDMEIIQGLESSTVVGHDIIHKMNYIVDQFDRAFELPESEQDMIFTHDAMQNSPFWSDLREVAGEIATALECCLKKYPKPTE